LEPKHKIFLSHSGAQKTFVVQLCKDLEDLNYFPFFIINVPTHYLQEKGIKPKSLMLPKIAKYLWWLILSREYLSSKWPMLELVEFV